LGASVKCALLAGEELCSFACAMQGPAATMPQTATAKRTCLSISKVPFMSDSILGNILE